MKQYLVSSFGIRPGGFWQYSDDLEGARTYSSGHWCGACHNASDGKVSMKEGNSRSVKNKISSSCDVVSVPCFGVVRALYTLGDYTRWGINDSSCNVFRRVMGVNAFPLVRPAGPGTLIHASIRKNLAQSYRPQLNEGSVYAITNFLVEENKGNYRPIHNNFKILFNSTTSVSKISGLDHSIPQLQFEIADYETIASRCYETTYLTGDYQLSSTFATKLYVNLDIPEVAEIKDKLNTTMGINVKEIMPKGLPKVQDGEPALHNRKTVAEIKDLEWNSETKDLLVTCNAKIINVNNKYGWYYIACLIFKTKVKQIKGVLWCDHCKNEPKFAVPSYGIQVQVQDETGSTTFVLFDKGAEKIISKTAKELAETQEEKLKLDDNVLPREIQRMIGNEYFF
ncbi:uncharacterized protein LOC142620215 [Castanea sativa]|uniref:uncharacterized protein LOC142620215 n=1 Tax=Castanea sativa TaxID=21020 RepID=UPI003F64E862